MANSRETSPTRNNVHQTVRRLGYLSSQSPRNRQERPPIIPSRPVLAQKILQASREAENALADALVCAFGFVHKIIPKTQRRLQLFINSHLLTNIFFVGCSTDSGRG